MRSSNRGAGTGSVVPTAEAVERVEWEGERAPRQDDVVTVEGKGRYVVVEVVVDERLNELMPLRITLTLRPIRERFHEAA